MNQPANVNPARDVVASDAIVPPTTVLVSPPTGVVPPFETSYVTEIAPVRYVYNPVPVPDTGPVFVTNTVTLAPSTPAGTTQVSEVSDVTLTDTHG